MSDDINCTDKICSKRKTIIIKHFETKSEIDMFVKSSLVHFNRTLTNILEILSNSLIVIKIVLAGTF